MTLNGCRCVLLWLALVLGSTPVAADASLELFVDDPAALKEIERRFGRDARLRMLHVAKIIAEGPALSEQQKLHAVNDFFNLFRFVPDSEEWGVEDYWASPLEFISHNAGDCEDFALAKYFTLLSIGVSSEQLRLTYVNALELGQAHMVVTFYPKPEAEPLVLDNLTSDILPASERPDLTPVYSFNGVGLWLAKERGKGRFVGSSSQLTRWAELNRKMADARLLP